MSYSSLLNNFELNYYYLAAIETIYIAETRPDYPNEEEFFDKEKNSDREFSVPGR